jgi:hypothetical protein
VFSLLNDVDSFLDYMNVGGRSKPRDKKSILLKVVSLATNLEAWLSLSIITVDMTTLEKYCFIKK